MSAGDHIAGSENRADAYSACFLPLRLMDCSRKPSLKEQVIDAFLEHAAEEHPAVHDNSLLRRQFSFTVRQGFAHNEFRCA